MLQCDAVCCSVLQCVAVVVKMQHSRSCSVVVCCSVLQCVAVCCSVSQRLPKDEDNVQVKERQRERERGWVWIVLTCGVC